MHQQSDPGFDAQSGSGTLATVTGSIYRAFQTISGKREHTLGGALCQPGKAGELAEKNRGQQDKRPLRRRGSIAQLRHAYQCLPYTKNNSRCGDKSQKTGRRDTGPFSDKRRTRPSLQRPELRFAQLRRCLANRICVSWRKATPGLITRSHGPTEME